MSHRPLGHLLNLPRGSAGSHRRAAVERSLTRTELVAAPKHAPFPALDIFRPSAMWSFLKNYSRAALRQNVPFPTPGGDSIHRIENETKVAVAGDWGTGTEEAEQIATLIKNRGCEYTIHLGDVYYVGDKRSIDENCRGIQQSNGYDPVTWPSGTKGAFALNGNHEAYARDASYFEWIENTYNQESSCFLLHNDHWCLLALDTGYNSEGIPWIGWVAEHFNWKWLMPSCKLPDEAVIWLSERVRPLFTPECGIVILSHHQVISSFDNEYPNIAQQLSQQLKELTGRSVLWLWGHEHRLAAYGKYDADSFNLYGRCLGHGGMPVDRGMKTSRNRPLEFYDDRSYDPPNREIVKHDTVFGVNGFATLEFSNEDLKVTYLDISDDQVVTENWSIRQGNVVQVGVPVYSQKTRVEKDGRIVVP